MPAASADAENPYKGLPNLKSYPNAPVVLDMFGGSAASRPRHLLFYQRPGVQCAMAGSDCLYRNPSYEHLDNQTRIQFHHTKRKCRLVLGMLLRLLRNCRFLLCSGQCMAACSGDSDYGNPNIARLCPRHDWHYGFLLDLRGCVDPSVANRSRRRWAYMQN